MKNKTNVYDKARSGQLSVINEDLVREVDEKIHHNQLVYDFLRYLMSLLKFQEIVFMKL